MNISFSLKKQIDPQLTLNWLVGLVVAFGFLWGSGNASLFDEDEGAFAEATREMLALPARLCGATVTIARRVGAHQAAFIIQTAAGHDFVPAKWYRSG